MDNARYLLSLHQPLNQCTQSERLQALINIPKIQFWKMWCSGVCIHFHPAYAHTVEGSNTPHSAYEIPKSCWFLGYHVIFGFPCDLCWFLDFSLTYWDTNTIKVKPIFTLFSTHHLFSVIRQPTVAVHQTNFSLCHSVGWLASFCYRKYVSPFSIHLIMWVLSCSWSNSTVTGSISKARHVKLAITYLSVFITCIWMQLSLLC